VEVRAQAAAGDVHRDAAGVAVPAQAPERAGGCRVRQARGTEAVKVKKEINGIPASLAPGQYNVRFRGIRKHSETLVFDFVPEPDEPEPPRKAYLLVEVSEVLAEDVAECLPRVNGVLSVTEHEPGCCCKNCPWGGDHG
jgi:hypothetical protein